MITWWWVACTPEAVPPGPAVLTGPGEPTSTGDDDDDGLPFPVYLWTGADGTLLDSARVAGDLTGDGLVDALVEATGPGGPVTYLVAAPLRRRVVLPGDELAAFDGATWSGVVGDATGDGLADVVVTADGATRVVEAPLADVDARRLPVVDGAVFDLNQDGVLDRTITGPGGSDVWWGPSDRWSGDPDLHLAAWDCPYLPEPPPLVPYPDLTGDSVPDVLLGTWVAPECVGWLFSVPAGGTYDPADDPFALPVYEGVQGLPDQTGDGLPDALIYQFRPVKLLGGPLKVTNLAFDSVRGPSLALPPNLFTPLAPLGFDVNRDGYGDFLTSQLQLPDPAITWVLYGGGGSLANLSGVVANDVPIGAPFLEDDVPSMLVTVSGVTSVLLLLP